MLRLLADDLSGALDSAAPFAGAQAPVPVLWHDVPRCGSAAFDSETRHVAPDEAAEKSARFVRHLVGADIAFKKIDSVLRGQPAIEIAAARRAGAFETILIAPAFPAQGRITRHGRQFVCAPSGDRVAVATDLGRELESLGISARPGPPQGGGGVFLCDAIEETDLSYLASLRGDLSPPILWCGSGGLARALAGPSIPLEAAEVLAAPVLVIVGTDHHATRAQLQRLRGSRGAYRIARLDVDGDADAVLARASMERMVRNLAAEPAPGSAIVTGGETLMALCQALGAEALSVEGELAPGIAVSRFVGGRWDNTSVVSKSGGFGDPELLNRFLAHALEDVGHG